VNQTPVKKTAEWKSNFKEMNDEVQSKTGVAELKDIKEYKNAKRRS
jgi:hypothetical protein